MNGNNATYAELEIGLSRAAGGYQVELRFTDPESDAEKPPARGAAALDPQDLRQHELDAEGYGKALAAALFGQDEILDHFREVKTAVEAAGQFLRLRLRVDASADELQALRWELLCDPDTGDALATSEKMPFSRFMDSRDWRQVKPQPKSDLKALVAFASPTDVADFGLAPVDAAGEVERARKALADIRLEVAGDGEPLTLDHLVSRLRDGVDVLYLACHGAISRRGVPALYLQNADATTAITRGSDLAVRLRELTNPPRLVFLASCESGGTEAGTDALGEATAQASIAPLLAEAGVSAIVAMQGKISMTTIEQAVPVFFTELMKDGRIDRALAAARGRVRERNDCWMPALYSRLKSGRIWYQGFGGDGDEVKRWRALVGNLRAGKCVPILGPDVGRHLYGRASERAEELAERYGFPLEAHDRDDLTKVSQFVQVNESLAEARRAVLGQVKDRLGTKYKQVAQRCFEDDGDPFHILATLPFKVYVNAAFDRVLLDTLGANPERTPSLDFPTWRATRESHAHRKPAEAKKAELDGGQRASYRPTQDRPVVFHAYGIDLKNARDSLVLTEDDILDYLIEARGLLPAPVAGEMVQSSLIFLGFPLRGLAFRALLRLLLSLHGSKKIGDNAHVGVQVDPAEHSLEDVERARDYLKSYLRAAAPTIEVYWGDAADFLSELGERMRTIPESAGVDGDEEDDDDDYQLAGQA